MPHSSVIDFNPIFDAVHLGLTKCERLELELLAVEREWHGLKLGCGTEAKKLGLDDRPG